MYGGVIHGVSFPCFAVLWFSNVQLLQGSLDSALTVKVYLEGKEVRQLKEISNTTSLLSILMSGKDKRITVIKQTQGLKYTGRFRAFIRSQSLAVYHRLFVRKFPLTAGYSALIST